MKRSIPALLALVLLLGFAAGSYPAEAADTAVVSLRIEGKTETLYYNSELTVEAGSGLTLRRVIDAAKSRGDGPEITLANDGAPRIVGVGTLREHSSGGNADDRWLVRVNGTAAAADPDGVPVRAGDDIVIYYADPARIQYPRVDLSRMITSGIVRFTDENAAEPIAGAAVVWDGMHYTTDDNGEVIIDSTGAGVLHTVSIERYDESGLPTVLRLPPDCAVRYGFDDVAADAWYLEDVLYISERQLLKGVSESAFAPEEPMNRAMFVTVLGRLAGAAVDQTADTGFTDVVNDGWSAGYIAWATENGIVGGYGDGRFGQYDPITREQMAVILYRYAQNRGIDDGAGGADLSSFADAGSVSGYAQEAVQWLVGRGLMTGADGRLFPQGPATRAQAAAILRRFITEFKLI